MKEIISRCLIQITYDSLADNSLKTNAIIRQQLKRSKRLLMAAANVYPVHINEMLVIAIISIRLLRIENKLVQLLE